MSAQEQAQQGGNSQASSSSSSSVSPSNSISLVKLDELSSFGATKKARLPALIKLTSPLADLNSRDAQDQQRQQTQVANSMPDFSETQLDKMAAPGVDQQSLPANVQIAGSSSEAAAAAAAVADKENASKPADLSVDGFQVVEMEGQSSMDEAMVGPSLPAAPSSSKANDDDDDEGEGRATERSINAQLQSTTLDSINNPQYASHLGDSLIEMIINLRNENQNLVRALETNNDYVKERLSEFKKCQEESKRREQEYALEKAEHEHQIRKVQRQNAVLSERLKSMESKLKDMKLEVSESLNAAHSSKASSIRGEEILYPQLGDNENESFSNSALLQQQATTMQVDATSGELYNEGDQQHSSRPMETDQAAGPSDAQRVANMTRDELSKRFDANKKEFMAMEDPMKQCDQLEQQLNDMGKRDYEICLLQQQLNIYRQDFRLERMAKLEAKIQIEKLKNEIDRLCLERALEQQARGPDENQDDEQEHDARRHYGPTPATHAADGLIGKLGHHIGRKALRSAAKAAKYAAKQAHLEEKTAAALARAAAAKAAAAAAMGQTAPKAAPGGAGTGDEQPSGSTDHQPQFGHHHHHHSHHRRGHHHRHHNHEHNPSSAPRAPRTERTRGVGSEIVSDLINLGNKTMLTGYKMASTHVNLALDKLNQYEQQQASQLSGGVSAPAAADQQNKAKQPSAPPMEPPSMD